jgi:hypothetical protein
MITKQTKPKFIAVFPLPDFELFDFGCGWKAIYEATELVEVGLRVGAEVYTFRSNGARSTREVFF